MIAPFYYGEPIVCIAAGPSLTQEQCDRARKYRCIVINRAYEYAPWASIMYAADVQFWKQYKNEVPDIPVRIAAGTGSEEGIEQLGLMRVQGKHENGLSTDPAFLHWGKAGHSGYQAIGLAYHLNGGKAPIYLLGYDCRVIKGKRHFHGDHVGSLPNAPSCETWPQYYEAIAQQKLVDVINCTPGSAITCFPMGEL